jgi:class 3 adenylate cyclase
MIEGAVLFADLMLGPLQRELDEKAAAALIDSAMRTVERDIQAGNGRIVRAAGDEVLALFPSVAMAAASSIGMQRNLSTLSLAWPSRSRLRIGFAWGPFTEKDGDLLGDAVILASRASLLGTTKTIVLPGDSVARLNPDQRAKCSLLCAAALKNRPAKVEFFNLAWSE